MPYPLKLVTLSATLKAAQPSTPGSSIHAVWLGGVGHLVLEENVPSPIPVPDHLVLLIVLHEKSVRGGVVAVDHDAGVGSIVGPTHAVAVVGPPSPNVIKDDVVAVHDETIPRAARLCAADPEEHILKSRRVGGSIVTLGVPASHLDSAGEVVAPASKMIPEIMIPSARAVVIGTIPFSGIRVGKPRPGTTVSGRVT